MRPTASGFAADAHRQKGRVLVDLHHNPGDEDGRVWMLAFKGQIWRLTTDEFRQLSADALVALAHARTVGAEAERHKVPVTYGRLTPVPTRTYDEREPF